MTTRDKATAIEIVLKAFVILPIWYYLLYKILSMVNATELMWFLFWIYVPVGIMAQAIITIVGREP